MTIKTQTQLAHNSSTTQQLAEKQKVVISVFGNHAHGKTTAAILIAMGLAELGKAVHFVNLDEPAHIPLAVPYDQTPDIAILNCPNTADDSVVECAQVANICVIVSSPSPESIDGATEILQKISKHVPTANICVLPTATASQQQTTKVLQALSESSPIILRQLPALPLHSAISNCTSNGYLEKDATKAVKLALPSCRSLLNIVEGRV